MLRKLRDATIILQALRLMFKVYLPGLSTSTSNTEQVAPTYLQSSRAIGSRQYYQHPPPRMSIYLCEANEITFLFTPCFEKRSEKNLRSSRKKDTLPDNFVTRINSSLSIVTDLREKENKRMKGRKIKITESPKIWRMVLKSWHKIPNAPPPYHRYYFAGRIFAVFFDAKCEYKAGPSYGCRPLRRNSKGGRGAWRTPACHEIHGKVLTRACVDPSCEL